MSPHRYAGVYDELLSPPRRSVEPPYGARYGGRNNAPPPTYPPLGVKPIPLMGVQVPTDQTIGYRGRYDGPPTFDDIPPGVDPPVPGFEPSPFEKPPFGPPGVMERERLPPLNYRDPFRPSYVEGSTGYPRDVMSMPPVQNEIPVHVGEQQPRYRDNYRPGHPYRDQGPVPFRDGQMPFRESVPPAPYRDGGYRGPPPSFRESQFRNHPYRDAGFRENPSHPSFREGPTPFRPPSTDPREPMVNYHDSNYRDGFRDDNGSNRDHSRPGFRQNTRGRGGPRRPNNMEHDRHRERDGRERERYVETRDVAERNRDPEKRQGYEKNHEKNVREPREDRPREYEKNREYDRSREYEKEREHDKNSPDKKLRVSPRRSREIREKKRSESRGRSRDKERDSRRDKKDDRVRDKTSVDRNKEHKDKDKKLKDRKKKKREKEKEKESEKKKKREKKDKKEKDSVKKDDEGVENTVTKEVTDIKEPENCEKPAVKKSGQGKALEVVKKEDPAVELNEKCNDLYDDEAAEAVDKEIIQNYVKNEADGKTELNKNDDAVMKEEPFDGIEIQVTPEDYDLKTDVEGMNDREMLAPMPELSKWEVDDENQEKFKEPGEITSPEQEEDGGKVTSEVIKRAENAIFAKAINSLIRPIEIKKISSDRLKLYGDETEPKSTMNNIQITVPVTEHEQRSIEINERKRRYSKTPPPKLSIKERLGGKVEAKDSRVVHSTVERVKSRSKTPKTEQAYRKVTVDRNRGRKLDSVRQESAKSDRRVVNEIKNEGKHRGRSPNKDSRRKDGEKISKDVPKKSDQMEASAKVDDNNLEKNQNADRERKKSALDEAHFEPDYDETVESENEMKEDIAKKNESTSERDRGPSEPKKPKIENETIALNLTNVKKKPDTDSDSSSGSEYSSSSSSSDARKRKKKKKRAKKKKKRAASESDSDSDSSADEHKKKKKKRKHHKKKSSKKKKKSKNK